MLVLQVALLILCLVAMGYFVHRDLTEYANFKLFTKTADRQRKYLAWVREGFLLFTCLTGLCLAVLGRLRAVTTLPPEFGALAEVIRSKFPKAELPSASFMVGFGGAMLVGLIGGIVLPQLLAKKRKGKSGPIVIGDIEALMPCNWPETGCTALLSLNAGLGEELFFRLLLPLLLTLILHNAPVAFALAAIIFGLAHLYQGVLGIVATTALGVVITAVYLWTGNLWIVICLHAGFDLIGLVIRPTITRAFTARRSPASSEVSAD
jgi:membrane protease YdiL (CAAX protease family)